MTREDVPHVILTVFFGMLIFAAGRYSAPTPTAPEPQVVVLHDAPATTSSVVIINTAAPPLLEVLPVQALPEASASVAPPPPSAPRFNAPAPKPVVSAPVKPENIVLEEVPENPYRHP